MICLWAAIRPNTGSTGLAGAAAAGTGGIVASARTVPPAATPAAWDRKCRRVETAGAVMLLVVLLFGLAIVLFLCKMSCGSVVRAGRVFAHSFGPLRGGVCRASGSPFLG